MPLHPQCQAFLKQLDALNIPPLDQLRLDQVRALSVPVAGELAPVDVIEDLCVARQDGSPDVPVRVYRPVADGRLRPGLVFFHGGGWVIGTLDNYDSLCREIAVAGDCVVVSVDYRLAPEHRFPAGVEDACAATVWVLDRAATLGIDAARVLVGGDSAGGNLTAAVSLMLRGRDAGQPAAQVLVYPITSDRMDSDSYHEFAEGYMLTRRSMQWFWQQYLDDPQQSTDERCSPLRAADLSGLPPALVLTAEFDVLRDEGEAYAARLHEAGVPVSRHRFDGMIHGFLRRTDLYDKAHDAIRLIGDWIRAT